MLAFKTYVLDECDFSGVTKHATSMIKALTNANFRCFHIWNKKGLTHGKRGMDYSVVNDVPYALKSFILQLKQEHIKYFQRPRPQHYRTDPVEYDDAEWMNKMRKMFCDSQGNCFDKALKVKKYN